MARAWNVVVGVACAWCGVAVAIAKADVVKLADLEARALSQRPEVAASAARVLAAGAEIGAAESAYYPQLSASVDGSLAPGRKLIKIPGSDYLVSGSESLAHVSAFEPHPRYGATITARGNVYDFGRTRSALEAARAKQRASEADASARAQVLVLEVRAAYLRWSVAQELWEISKRAETDAKARAERVAGLIAEGAAPPSAATAASAQANAAASESERAELELDTARLELGYLSARDLGPDTLPDPTLLEVHSQPSAASASDRSGAVGPLAMKFAPPGTTNQTSPELTAKYLQPSAASGPAPGPGTTPPSAAPSVTPPKPPLAAPVVAPGQAAATVGGTPEAASAALPPTAASPASDASPQLAALETAHAAAEAARRLQARMSAPALGYRMNAGIEGQDGQIFPAYGMGIGLTIPLWDGGATSAAEAGARAAEAELAAELDAERARDKHVRTRRSLQIEHADRLLALAENGVALAETRVQQLQEGPTLATPEQQALSAAEADRTRANAELVRAKAARVQLTLGL